MAVLTTCGTDSPTQPASVKPLPPPVPVPNRVTVSLTTVTLSAVGQTESITAKVFDQNNAVLGSASVIWTSSSPGVATVSTLGVVTAVSNGVATITARSGSASSTVTVTVKQSVASITIEPSSATLKEIGKTVELAASVLDQNGQLVSGAMVSWQSSDDGVATVSTQGVVTAVSNGVATITARSGSASSTATVTVMETYTLSGIVTDGRRAGLAIPGATVRLRNGTEESMTADERGQYRFSNVSGQVEITVSAKPIYREQTIEITVDSDYTQHFTLEHTGLPPFSGTVWITPEILGPEDPTSFGEVTYTGRGMREIFDRRVDEWITVNAYLFNVQFGDRTAEWQFNPEFGSPEAARAEIAVFAPAIGRMPAALLSNLKEVEVNAGQGDFGGNGYNGSYLIHTEDQATIAAVSEGFLEEVFLHEGAHMSLDREHGDSPGWRVAQEADGVAISEYARDFPDGEDIAESILPYFAVRYRPERLTESERWLMMMSIPNRLDYFDEQELDMSPYTLQPSIVSTRSASFNVMEQ